MATVYCVEASYSLAKFGDSLDPKLEKLVGRRSDVSVYQWTVNSSDFGFGQRDLNWDYKKKSAAEAAASRLRVAKVEGVKVRLRSYED